MDTKLVPQVISALIEIAEEDMGKKELQLKESALQEENEIEAVRRKETEEFFAEVLSQIPDVIRPFVDLTAWVKDSGLYGYSFLNRYLRFDIPGLAPIVISFRVVRDEQPEMVAWIVAGVVGGYFDDGVGDYIDANYSLRDRYSNYIAVNETEFRFVLLAASTSATNLLKARSEKSYRIQLRDENERKREEKKAREDAEQRCLFDALKNDGIALNLLKAFVLLRDERSHFESQLNEADETMSSIEDRWTRKASDLRRQADEAARKAEEERYRLESDLSDVESQLSKVKRG